MFKYSCGSCGNIKDEQFSLIPTTNYFCFTCKQWTKWKDVTAKNKYTDQWKHIIGDYHKENKESKARSANPMYCSCDKDKDTYLVVGNTKENYHFCKKCKKEWKESA